MATSANHGQVTLTVDRIRCDAYGLCAELLPELIDLDDWGYPIVTAGSVPDDLVADARRAVAACPLLALRLRPVPRATMHAPAAARVPVATRGG
jgi:ferredoxin